MPSTPGALLDGVFPCAEDPRAAMPRDDQSPPAPSTASCEWRLPGGAARATHGAEAGWGRSLVSAAGSFGLHAFLVLLGVVLAVETIPPGPQPGGAVTDLEVAIIGADELAALEGAWAERRIAVMMPEIPAIDSAALRAELAEKTPPNPTPPPGPEHADTPEPVLDPPETPPALPVELTAPPIMEPRPVEEPPAPASPAPGSEAPRAEPPPPFDLALPEPPAPTGDIAALVPPARVPITEAPKAEISKTEALKTEAPKPTSAPARKVSPQIVLPQQIVPPQMDAAKATPARTAAPTKILPQKREVPRVAPPPQPAPTAARTAPAPTPAPGPPAGTPSARGTAGVGDAAANRHASARGGTGGVAPTAGRAALADYRARLVAHLSRFKQYPEAAQDRGLTGRNSVAVTLAPDGRVVSSSLAAASGHALLDAATLAALKRAQPFPAIPAGLPPNMTVTIGLRYDLR